MVSSSPAVHAPEPIVSPVNSRGQAVLFCTLLLPETMLAEFLLRPQICPVNSPCFVMSILTNFPPALVAFPAIPNQPVVFHG